jgi:hypothetical protein
LWKIKTSDCSEAWLYTHSGEKYSAFESIAPYHNDGLVVGGVINVEDSKGIEAFKSAGQVSSGEAAVCYFNKAKLQTAPTSADRTRSFAYISMISVKYVEASTSSANDYGVVAVAGVREGEVQGVQTHAVLWIPQSGPTISSLLLSGQATDIAVPTKTDATKIDVYVSGLNKTPGTKGAAWKILLDRTGSFPLSLVWGRSYIPTAPGGLNQYTKIGIADVSGTITHALDDKKVLTECWGVAIASNGQIVLACGNGIEPGATSNFMTEP